MEQFTNEVASKLSTSFEENARKIIQTSLNEVIHEIRTRLQEQGVEEDIINTALKGFQIVAKRKSPPQDVILVTNYSQKAHVLFGDFKDKYASFREEFLKPQRYIKASPRLRWGYGWVFPINRLSDVKQALDKADFDYKEYTREEYAQILEEE